MKNGNFCDGMKAGMEAVISDASQSGNPRYDKFKEAAREMECDDDPPRLRERVGKLVKHKPVEKAPEGE
jgi:hypothetical protein